MKQILPAILEVFTILPCSGRTNGRHAFVTMITPYKLTASVFSYSCLVWRMVGPIPPTIPALFTTAHKPKYVNISHLSHKDDWFNGKC
jgi:hypothetical protein